METSNVWGEEGNDDNCKMTEENNHIEGDNHIIYIFQPPTCLRQVFIISKATDFIKLAATTGLYSILSSTP